MYMERPEQGDQNLSLGWRFIQSPWYLITDSHEETLLCNKYSHNSNLMPNIYLKQTLKIWYKKYFLNGTVQHLNILSVKFMWDHFQSFYLRPRFPFPPLPLPLSTAPPLPFSLSSPQPLPARCRRENGRRSLDMLLSDWEPESLQTKTNISNTIQPSLLQAFLKWCHCFFKFCFYYLRRCLFFSL